MAFGGQDGGDVRRLAVAHHVVQAEPAIVVDLLNFLSTDLVHWVLLRYATHEDQ